MAYRKGNEQGGLFDTEERRAMMIASTSGITRLNALIDWEGFRSILTEIVRPNTGEAGGAPSWDPVLMLKVLVLQRLHDLSDDQTQWQILDRLSFQAFLGLGTGDRVPDAKTIWKFKERLGATGMKAVFDQFHRMLQAKGLRHEKGKVVDATFIEMPKQRNTREENAAIKAGERPAEFDQNPARGRQKDTDARWVNKHGVNHFGYKNHIKANVLTKLVEDFTVTPASTHDSQALEALVKPGDGVVLADSAYTGEPCENVLTKAKVRGLVIEKATRGHALSPAQEAFNREKAKVRCRVEHIFARLSALGACAGRRIGLARATFEVGLGNLVYNLERWDLLQKKGCLDAFRRCPPKLTIA